MKKILFSALIVAILIGGAYFVNYHTKSSSTEVISSTSESFFSTETVDSNGLLTYNGKIFTGSKHDIQKLAEKHNFALKNQPENDSAILITTWSNNLKCPMWGLFVKINTRWERIMTGTGGDLRTIKELGLKEKNGIWYLYYKVYEEGINGTLQYIGHGEFTRNKTWKFSQPEKINNSAEDVEKTSYS